MEPIEIENIRKSLDLTQEKFAHVLGTTVTTVNRWECGRAKPSRLYIRELKELRKNHESYICRRKDNQ